MRFRKTLTLIASAACLVSSIAQAATIYWPVTRADQSQVSRIPVELDVLGLNTNGIGGYSVVDSLNYRTATNGLVTFSNLIVATYTGIAHTPYTDTYVSFVITNALQTNFISDPGVTVILKTNQSGIYAYTSTTSDARYLQTKNLAAGANTYLTTNGAVVSVNSQGGSGGTNVANVVSVSPVAAVTNGLVITVSAPTAVTTTDSRALTLSSSGNEITADTINVNQISAANSQFVLNNDGSATFAGNAVTIDVNGNVGVQTFQTFGSGGFQVDSSGDVLAPKFTGHLIGAATSATNIVGATANIIPAGSVYVDDGSGNPIFDQAVTAHTTYSWTQTASSDTPYITIDTRMLNGGGVFNSGSSTTLRVHGTLADGVAVPAVIAPASTVFMPINLMGNLFGILYGVVANSTVTNSLITNSVVSDNSLTANVQLVNKPLAEVANGGTEHILYSTNTTSGSTASFKQYGGSGYADLNFFVGTSISTVVQKFAIGVGHGSDAYQYLQPYIESYLGASSFFFVDGSGIYGGVWNPTASAGDWVWFQDGTTNTPMFRICRSTQTISNLYTVVSTGTNFENVVRVATAITANTLTVTNGITGNLTGNVTGNTSGSAASFTGNLSGNVTGTQGATVVSSVPSAALPAATTSALGGVKPDGTSITVSSGAIAVGNHSASLLTSGTVPLARLSSQTVVATGGSTQTITWASTTLQTDEQITLSANLTISFSGATDGETLNVAIINTSGNYTVTWPTVKWAGNTAPTQTIGAHTDFYTLHQLNGNIYGSAVQNF